MLDLLFIRHAESQGNVNKHLIGGQSNHLLLTERGEEQAKRLGQRLKSEGITFDNVYSSVAVRAKETARIACEINGFSPERIAYSEKLVELSQGEWEGKVRKDIHTPELLDTIRNSPDFIPPGGESQKDVETRMYQWIEESLLQQVDSSPKLIGIFSHGMAIKCLLRRLLNTDYHVPYFTVIHNTSLTRLRLINNNWLLERVNDHAHLQGMDFVPHYG